MLQIKSHRTLIPHPWTQSLQKYTPLNLPNVKFGIFLQHWLAFQLKDYKITCKENIYGWNLLNWFFFS